MFLIFCLFAFCCVVVIAICVRYSPVYSYDEIETTHTVLDPAHTKNISGNLRRQIDENLQDYVIDPADQKKIFVNTNDDMYEDANGKIWRVV